MVDNLRIWKISQGSDIFDKEERLDLLDKRQVCAHRKTPAKGRSSVSQGENFFSQERAGDYFYLCHGNHSVEVFGRFKKTKKTINGWIYRDYEIIFESKLKGIPYKGDKYWWTPNDNSTFIEVPQHNFKEFERMILKPFFGKTISDIHSATTDKNVSLSIEALNVLFKRPLNIPDYQRIYCWPEKNVLQLLEDIRSLHGEYRLGSIILQNTDENKCDIIDGQQRLVTLTLLLKELGQDTSLPLSECSFKDDEAIKYLRYNTYIIQQYVSKFRDKFPPVETIYNELTFNVLVLNNNSRELAYTFFSNENSRGKSLSDYDLLKAHHLRYVYEPAQQKHLARRWDKLLLKESDVEDLNERDYVRTLSVFIFRLRKWLNQNDWDDFEPQKIKNEFEAAPIIEAIPPFGEKFNYFEPIQGGSHFFGYVSHFIYAFNKFRCEKLYQAIHKNLVGETHTWLRDCIEALLFAYYLKFGMNYIYDAFILITRIVSQKRYEKSRLQYEYIITQHVLFERITLMIERATSPTFCLAEMLNRVNTLIDIENMENKDRPVITRYRKCLRKVLEEINNDAQYVIEINDIAKSWLNV